MRTLLITGNALTQVGCSHEADLRSPDGQFIGRATVEFEGDSSGNVTLERNGVIYRGLWSASKVDESGKIARSHGLHRQKYQNYQHGCGNYLRSGASTSQSQQGGTLNCEFEYRESAAPGWCKSKTETFEFMEQS